MAGPVILPDSFSRNPVCAEVTRRPCLTDYKKSDKFAVSHTRILSDGGILARRMTDNGREDER